MPTDLPPFLPPGAGVGAWSGIRQNTQRALPRRTKPSVLRKPKSIYEVYFQCASFGTTASICARTCSAGQRSVAISY